jgi:hypothetical protein
MKMGGSKKVRCAIYTRVSTDQGLEQDFNSLDAQYDASQAYIRSQQHAGWMNCWVTETNEMPCRSNSSTSLAKSANERVRRSTL